MKKLKVFIFILLVVTAIPVVAQDTIMVHWSNNKTRIDFLNSSGKTDRSIPLEETNPYLINFKPAYTGTKKLHFSFTSEASTPGKGFAIVTYSAIVYEVSDPEKGGYQLQDLGESTMLVYDKQGVIIFLDTIHADNASQPRITADGKYASISFVGGVYGQSARRTGTLIYHLPSGNVIARLSLQPAYTWLMGDFFVYSEWDSERHTYYVFNVRDKVFRSKTYTRTEASLLKRLDETGIVFMVPPDKERKERYDSFAIVR